MESKQNALCGGEVGGVGWSPSNASSSSVRLRAPAPVTSLSTHRFSMVPPPGPGRREGVVSTPFPLVAPSSP